MNSNNTAETSESKTQADLTASHDVETKVESIPVAENIGIRLFDSQVNGGVKQPIHAYLVCEAETRSIDQELADIELNEVKDTDNLSSEPEAEIIGIRIFDSQVNGEVIQPIHVYPVCEAETKSIDPELADIELNEVKDTDNLSSDLLSMLLSWDDDTSPTPW